jgi:hypothetical protein
MTRLVSGSKLWPSKNIAMDTRISPLESDSRCVCTRRRQDFARAIINDATPQKIAAVKVTVSKGSQVCT